jgi:hypothetical protein
VNLPFADDSFAAVVGVDLWRILNPTDLSSFILQGLRASDNLFLVMSKHLGHDDANGLGLACDVRYITDMLGSRFLVDVIRDDDRAAVLRCRTVRPALSGPE